MTTLMLLLLISHQHIHVRSTAH